MLYHKPLLFLTSIVMVAITPSGYHEVDGKYCLLVKNTYKKSFGIVHAISNTGNKFSIASYITP